MKRKNILLILVGILALAVTYFLYENRKFENYLADATPAEGLNIPVNPAAPVATTSEIIIQAPVASVWNTLANIDAWPEWQSSVTQAELNGSLTAGTTFDWKAGGLRFHSVLHTVAEPQLLGWTGTTFGAAAVHNWRFLAEGDATRVIVEESLQGVFPTLFSGSFQRNLETGMQDQLAELKAAAEREP